MQERGPAPPLIGAPEPGSPTARRWLLTAAVAVVVVAADQLTKSWAVHRLAHGPIHVVWRLDLVLDFNTGSAFGLAQGWAPVVGGLALTVVVGLLAVLRKVRTTVLAVALGLVVGGAVGNLSDRVFRGHHGAVVDVVALHFWPTFNVADSCIVVGVIVAVADLWRADTARAAKT